MYTQHKIAEKIESSVTRIVDSIHDADHFKKLVSYFVRKRIYDRTKKTRPRTQPFPADFVFASFTNDANTFAEITVVLSSARLIVYAAARTSK